MRKLFQTILLALCPFASALAQDAQGLVINEVMVANIDMFLDPSFNYGSWIELYNPTGQAVSVAGLYLSSDEGQPFMCQLPAAMPKVPAKGFLTLWFGHREDYCPLQIEDVSLDSDGGFIGLFDKAGCELASVLYPESLPRISYARTADGGQEWGLTGYPTPGRTNSTSQFAAEMLPAPVISVDSRLFTETFYIGVEIPEGGAVYYTKDCSTPVPGANGVQTSGGSHTVDDTRIYRFRAYKDGYLPSPVVTRSYIKTSDDYSIPVISIVTANDNFYGTEYGLWAKGPNGKSGNGQNELCNWNWDWDRPANVEIIDTANRMIVNQEVEVTPSGRYSRAYEPHPMKIQAKKKYGYDNFFPFTPFSDKPFNKYKALKLRNGGNFNTTRFKDAAIHEIIMRSGLNLDCQAYQPAQHYINGVFMGIINIREPNNKDYAFANYGIDDDDIDFFKVDHKNGLNNGGYTLVNGSSDAWDEWYRLSARASDPDVYERICQLVDIEEFANYLAVEFYLFNWDWPRNNVKAFRQAGDDGRFRFILFDLDYCFGEGSSTPWKNVFQSFDDEENRSEADGGGLKTVIVPLVHNMLQNEQFRKLFADSYSIVACSVFDQKRCSEIIGELEARATREMAFNNESPASDVTKLRDNLTTSYRTNKLNELKAWSYAGLGSTEMITKNLYVNIPEARLTLNGLPIPTGKFEGRVFLPATVKAEAPYGYVFQCWKNDAGGVVSKSAEYKLNSKAQTLTATFVPAGDDAMGNRPVRINEVSPDNAVFMNDSFKKADWIELYNTTDKAINVGGMMLSDDPDLPGKYIIPDGTVIQAHGFLVVWCDKSSFKLGNGDGQIVMLTAADGSWTDVFRYDWTDGHHSVGLYPDGGDRTYVMHYPSLSARNRLNSFDQLLNDGVLSSVKVAGTVSEDSLIYDLLGRPVISPEPGRLYIKDGRKFFYR